MIHQTICFKINFTRVIKYVQQNESALFWDSVYSKINNYNDYNHYHPGVSVSYLDVDTRYIEMSLTLRVTQVVWYFYQ